MVGVGKTPFLIKHINVDARLLVWYQHIHDKQKLQTCDNQLLYTQNLNQTINLIQYFVYSISK